MWSFARRSSSSPQPLAAQPPDLLEGQADDLGGGVEARARVDR